MQQSVNAAEVNKGAVICQTSNCAANRVALFNLSVETLLDGALLLFGHRATIHDEVFVRHIQLDNATANLLTN